MATLRERYLKASDEIKKSIKVPLQVRKDKNNLEKWLIDMESEVAGIELDIEGAKGKETFDANKILDLQDDLALKVRRLAEGEKLMQELFTEGAPELNAPTE